MALLFPFLVPASPKVSLTSGLSWLYLEWNAQSATFRVLYRESGTPDYQVIAPPTSQLSHNISALQPNTLYHIVVEATHTVTQQKVNSSVTDAYTTPHCKLKDVCTNVLFTVDLFLTLPPASIDILGIHFSNVLANS